MCGLECGLWGLTSRVGSGRDGESAPLSPRQRLAVLTGWGGEGTQRVQGARRVVRSEAGLRPPTPVLWRAWQVLGEPRSPSFFPQCPAGISQALPVGSCAFRTACGPPFPGAPPRLTLPPNPRPQVPPTQPAAQPGLVCAPRACTSAPALCPAPTRGLRPLPCPQVRRTQ